MTDIWIPDAHTYYEIQKLIPFVQLVAELPFASAQQQQTASEIIQLIQTIQQPQTHKWWYVQLAIIDVELWGGTYKTHAVYSRSWTAYFEQNFLEIEARTNHTEEPIYHWGNDFYFSGGIFFNADMKGANRICLQQDIQTFVNDALDYKQYMKDTLNSIEIDVDVY